MGGHGHRLCQCRTAKISTLRVIPIQIDGEPWRLQPSVISISWRNQASVVMKPKRRNSLPVLADCQAVSRTSRILERHRIQVSIVSAKDFEQLQFDKEKLILTSYPLGIILVEVGANLSQVRMHVSRLQMELAKSASGCGASHEGLADDNWQFLDSTTTDRFFRIDRQEEPLRLVSDVSTEDLYLLNATLKLRQPQPTSTGLPGAGGGLQVIGQQQPQPSGCRRSGSAAAGGDFLSVSSSIPRRCEPP